MYLARYLPEVQEGISGAEKESQSTRMDRALNDRRLIARGKLMYEKILLDAGEKFAIIVKIKTPDTVHPAAIEYDAGDGIARVDLTDGEGYLSHDGSLWERVEETQKCNLCLKAYTNTKG